MGEKPWVRQLVAFSIQAKQVRDSNKAKENAGYDEVSLHLERSFMVLRHRPLA
jgi:hypothetical protein